MQTSKYKIIYLFKVLLEKFLYSILFFGVSVPANSHASLCLCIPPEVPLARGSVCLDIFTASNENLEDLEECGWQDGAVCVGAQSQVCVDLMCVWGQAWNSDKWAYVVSCGETWISPVWL